MLGLIAIVPNAGASNPVSLLDETLTYDVIYKWGFINKVAGYATMSYTYIAHENGKYKKDVLTFHRDGNTFTADAVRYKRKIEGEPLTSSTIHLEAQGMTVDMLSSFFYLRTLDFPNMKKGQSVTVNIFSGSKKEKLKITYMGTQNVSLNGRSFPSYYINFTFTRRGVESSAPISGWISTDGQRIPLKVEGKLPVGKVRALYTGPNP